MKTLASGILMAWTAFADQPSVAQRNDACYAMRGQRSPEAVQAMRKAIDDPVVRACAARNLREAGAVEALMEALASDAPDTRMAAARELGALHAAQALEALGRAAMDDNVMVAAAAVEALGTYQDRIVLPHLLKAAGQAGVVGVAALEAAARFKDGAVLPAARRVLAQGDVASQVIAIAIIGDLGDAADLPKLREVAAHSEPMESRGRGFGFMPAIDLARVAANAITKIQGRVAAQ